MHVSPPLTAPTSMEQGQQHAQVSVYSPPTPLPTTTTSSIPTTAATASAALTDQQATGHHDPAATTTPTHSTATSSSTSTSTSVTMSMATSTSPTLLSAPVASLVTALATSARLSVRLTAFFVEAMLETSQYSTRLSLGYTRRILISAISSARRVYLANAALDAQARRALTLAAAHAGAMGFVDGKAAELASTDTFLNVLDRWTNLGIYVIHHTFTMAELFAMSSFYLTSNAVQSASFAAQESVVLFDSLFGSNESSRALSSIITLVRKELLEDDRFKAADRGKVASLTALTKALTAFACLQNATWSRSAHRLQMKVLYDCTVVTRDDESFSATGNVAAGPAEGTGPSSAGSRRLKSANGGMGDGVVTERSVAAQANVDDEALASDSEQDTSFELLRQLEELIAELPDGEESSDGHADTGDHERRDERWLRGEATGGWDQTMEEASAPTLAHEQRLRRLKRVREDLFEITDELSESTFVTQTLERITSLPSGLSISSHRARPNTVHDDVLVETLESDDDGDRGGGGLGDMVITPSPSATSLGSIEETDWIEVDQILYEDEGDGAPSVASSSMIPSNPNGRAVIGRTMRNGEGDAEGNPANSDRIQVVLRTMTNKLLQRKRIVRRVQGGNGNGVAGPSALPPRPTSPSPLPGHSGSSNRSDLILTPKPTVPVRGDVRDIHWSSPSSSASVSVSGSSTPTRTPVSTPIPTPGPTPSKSRWKNRFVNRGGRGGGAGAGISAVTRGGSASPPARDRRLKMTPPTSPTRVTKAPPPTPNPTPSRRYPHSAHHHSDSHSHVPGHGHSVSGSGATTTTIQQSVRTRSNRVQAESAQVLPTPGAVDTPASLFPHDSLVGNIHRFMRYSSAAYGQNFLRLFGLGNADFHFPSTAGHHANSWAFAQHTSIPIESLLLSSYTDESPTFNTKSAPPLVHYIAVEHRLKAVVLTCRGTLGLSDVLVDLTCDYQTIAIDGGDPDGAYFVHSGMYQSALQLTDKHSTVHQTLVGALNKYPDYGLVLCGHSLGGGVAALLAIASSMRSDIFSAAHKAAAAAATSATSTFPYAYPLPAHPPISTPFVTSVASGLPPGRPIHCYAYGMPAVASADLARYTEGLISSVVQNSDVVPCLSLGVLRDLKNIAVTLFEEGNVAEEIVTRIVGLNRRKFGFQESNAATAASTTSSSAEAVATNVAIDDDQILSDWLMSLIKTMRADMDNDKLYPPGMVYIMEYFDVFVADTEGTTGSGGKAKSHKQAQRVILRQCDTVQERFREPLFSKTMLNDHMPSQYERSTQLLYDGLGQETL